MMSNELVFIHEIATTVYTFAAAFALLVETFIKLYDFLEKRKKQAISKDLFK